MRIRVFCFVFFIFCAATCFSQVSGFKELSCEHFVIYYSPQVSYDYVLSVRDMGERFFSRITEEFNLIRDKLWLWDNRAKMHIAKDTREYNEKFSCPVWSGACVDYTRRLIYTFYSQQNFSTTLAHELTHIIFREYVGEKNLPLWLDEGIAVYMEDKYGKGNYQRGLSVVPDLVKNNNYIPFAELNQITEAQLRSKSNQYVEIFYMEAFSIINFLVKERSKETFGYFLFCLKNNKNFDEALYKAYGVFMDIKKLEGEWKKFYRA